LTTKFSEFSLNLRDSHWFFWVHAKQLHIGVFFRWKARCKMLQTVWTNAPLCCFHAYQLMNVCGVKLCLRRCAAAQAAAPASFRRATFTVNSSRRSLAELTDRSQHRLSYYFFYLRFRKSRISPFTRWLSATKTRKHSVNLHKRYSWDQEHVSEQRSIVP